MRTLQTLTLSKTETLVTDEQLMVELQQGNRNAFDDLVNRYHQDAIRLAYYYAANWEDARDLSQDAFIKVYQQAHMFDTSQAFRPWFFRILVNHTLNFLKRKKRIRFSSLFERNGTNLQSDGYFAEQVQDPGNGETEFYTKHLVWNALNQLTPHHRSVLVLHEIEGLKEYEIADILKCSVGTVKSRLHYARKKMKKIVGNELE